MLTFVREMRNRYADPSLNSHELLKVELQGVEDRNFQFQMSITLSIKHAIFELSSKSKLCFVRVDFFFLDRFYGKPFELDFFVFCTL